jgi:hypothetical protein
MDEDDSPAEKAALAWLIRMMDLVLLHRHYDNIGDAARLYRDEAVKKLFQVIAGRDPDGKYADVGPVMHRWYNTSAYFKVLRKERDEKKISLHLFVF